MLDTIFTTTAVKTGLVGLTIGLLVYWLMQKFKYRLPPGPFPLPLIGNLHRKLAYWVKNSTDDILKYFFLIFPRKQDLTFHANCPQSRQFACNVKAYFLGKIRKHIINVSSVEVVLVKI